MFLTLPPLIEAARLVRVDDPLHPDAIARSATGSVLLDPPERGRWREESIPEPDGALDPEWVGRESVAVTNADLWHADGITGRGVKVAVFDLGWVAVDAPVAVGEAATHDCFASVNCGVPFDPLRPHLDAELGIHGWACAEAVRDVAPGAELHLVRANSFTTLENAADWAVREGIQVVSISMSFYNDSFYDGTGPHEGIVRTLTEGGVLMVGSAGNDAQVHWSGPWVDADHDGRLDGDAGNAFRVYYDGNASAYLNWNQHGARCGETDLALAILEEDGTILEVQDDPQLAEVAEGEECAPVESLSATLEVEDWYLLEVRHVRGPTVGLRIDLNTRSGELDRPRPGGSILDPKSHPLVAAVGAVRADRYFDAGLEGFSSWGPTNGGAPKPDIVGPDRLSGVPYGPVGFTGTSASAPVVAALVALILEDDPSLTPREAFERLQAWAIPAEGTVSSPDQGFGAGRARLPIRDPGPQECGRRPLLLLALPFPLWWRRRRSRTGPGIEQGPLRHGS